MVSTWLSLASAALLASGAHGAAAAAALAGAAPVRRQAVIRAESLDASPAATRNGERKTVAVSHSGSVVSADVVATARAVRAAPASRAAETKAGAAAATSGRLDEHLYHPCGTSRADLVNQMQVYTVDRNTSGSRTVHRKQCIGKADLDFTPNTAWLLFTMADTRFVGHVKQLLRSLFLVPQKGGLPKKVVIADAGMVEGEVAELRSLAKTHGVPLVIDDVKAQMAKMSNLKGMRGVPEKLPYEGDGVGGAVYRVKSLAQVRWFKRLKQEGAQQLVVLDGGGVILGSLHRVRNFAASEGFYAGLTHISVLSSLVANSGLAPEALQRQRVEELKAKQVLPACFDYAKDFLVDETVAQLSTVGPNSDRRVEQLDTFEGGFLVFDGRRPWVADLMSRWEAVMADDGRWADNQAYYFPHDQKVLANEVWKSLLCGKDAPRRVHLLDTNNIRFGSVAQNPDGQPHKGRMAYAPSEKTPWSGYTYHYCMQEEWVRHRCMQPVAYEPRGWEAFAPTLRHEAE